MPPPSLALRDIDAVYNAIRARLGRGNGSTSGGGAPGPPGPQGPPGPKGVVWKGPWALSQPYETGDIVTHPNANGVTMTYFCLFSEEANAGNEPQEGGTTGYWWELSPAYIVTDGSRPYVIGPSVPPTAEGSEWWSDVAGIHRLVQEVKDGQRLVSGQVYVRAFNVYGDIPAMRAVRMTAGTPSSDWLPNLYPATVDLPLDYNAVLDLVLGVTMQDSSAGGACWVCLHGIVTGDTSAFTGSNPVWLNAITEGDLGVMSVNEINLSNNGDPLVSSTCHYRICMGMALTLGTPGSMLVSPLILPRLGDLSDVNVKSFGGPSVSDVPMRLPKGFAETGPDCEGWRDYPPVIFPRVYVDYSPFSVPPKTTVVHVDCGPLGASGPVDVYLPSVGYIVDNYTDAAGCSREITVKKIDSTLNRVTIYSDYGNVDGETSQQLKRQGESVTFHSDEYAPNWRSA